MNKVILMGRLTRDPEVRYSQGENASAVVKYSLAVPRKFKQEGQADVDFINCVAFGKSAEFAEKYLRQGTKIAVVGRIQTGSYTNKDGNKVYTTDVVANRVEFLKRGDRAGSGSGFGMGQSSAPQSGDMGIPEGFSAIDDDDIPF